MKKRINMSFSRSFLQIGAAAIMISACTPEPTGQTPQANMVQPKPIRVLPTELGDCTLTITGLKTSTDSTSTFSMGYNTPMPKLKVFTWKPHGEQAELSFDGVGDGAAVHFNGTISLTEQTDNTYTFSTQGEMLGNEGHPPVGFTAIPKQIIITINPQR